MRGKTQTQEILSYAILEAQKLGLDAEALFLSYRESTMRSAWGQVHQTPTANSGVLSINLRDGLRAASVTTSELSRKAIRETVKSCSSLLRQVPENPYLPELLCQPDDLPEERLSLQNLQEFTEDLAVKERAFRLIEQSSRGTSLKGSARFFTAGCETGVANTLGLARYHTASYSFLSFAVTGDGGLSSYSDRAAATPDAVDVDGAIEEAFRRAALMERLPFLDPFANGARSLNYDAVFSHYAVGEWLYLVSMFSFNGLAVLDGQSFLSGKRIGERVTGQDVTIVDDWQDPLVIPLPFDFEGRARDRLTILDQGILRSVPYDGMTAKKAQVNSTGHTGCMPLCLVMSGGNESFDDLVAASGEPTIVATFLNYPS